MQASERVGEFVVVELRVGVMRNELPERDQEPVLTVRTGRHADRRRRDLGALGQQMHTDRKLPDECLRSIRRRADLRDQAALRQLDDRVIRRVQDVDAYAVEPQPPSEPRNRQRRQAGVRSDAFPFAHTPTMQQLIDGDEQFVRPA